MFLERCSIDIFLNNLCNYINSGEAAAGNSDFDFAKMLDEDAEEARDGLVEEKKAFSFCRANYSAMFVPMPRMMKT